MTERLPVFLNCAPWDMRSRNTDWRYQRYMLPRLAEFEPQLQMILQSSQWVSVLENLKAIRKAIGWRIGLPLSELAYTTGRLSARDLQRSGAKVVFTMEFPLNAGNTPVVWMNAIIDPEMQRSYGIKEETIQAEIAAKRPLFSRAARVQVTTEAEVSRHRSMFPETADRFHAVPYFVPHLQACNAEVLRKHVQPGPVRVLFVGNNAKRKGLPELLDAFLSLPATVIQQARLTILSNFDRSPMQVPSHPSIEVIRGANRQVVMQQMRDAHVFVNVAHLESFGIVYLEAMSQGIACMGPNWEVQRELLDDGRAGVNLNTDASSVRSVLERLILDAEYRHQLATNGWLRFQERYAPAVVAGLYREMFLSALS